MVKKFTLLELHLDDARFSNAIGRSPEEADGLLADVDDEMMDDDAMDESSSGRSRGRTLASMAFLLVIAVGVRTLIRRFRADDESLAAMDADDASVAVDLDEPVEA